ncbi:MAG: hypothetical protein ACLPTF_10890 [Steroidobacteraceae bacterium]
MNAVTDIPIAAPKSGNVQLGAAATPASTKRPLYFQDPFTDFAFLFTLSKQASKGSEIGECYAWRTLAEKVETLARSTEAKGHRVSARQSYLRAVTYYRNVLWGFRASDPGYRATLEKSRMLFKRFAALSEPPIEFVEIPYEGTVLPGYFLRPDASGKCWWICQGVGLNSFNGLPFRFDTEVPVKAFSCRRGLRRRRSRTRIRLCVSSHPRTGATTARLTTLV